jgi:hypothetical protein
MGTRFTISQLEKLKATGKILDFEVKAIPKENDIRGRKVAKLFKSKSTEKNWIANELLTWCNDKCLILQEEYKFHEKLKWRFDWCIENLKVAFE